MSDNSILIAVLSTNSVLIGALVWGIKRFVADGIKAMKEVAVRLAVLTELIRTVTDRQN